MTTFKWAVAFLSFGIFILLLNLQIIQLHVEYLKYWPALLIFFGIELILKAVFI